MLARRYAGLALVAGLVCGLARPAFADGALGVYDGIGQAVNLVLVLFALGIVALSARAIRGLRRRQAIARAETARAPELPEARVLNQRSRSEPKQ